MTEDRTRPAIPLEGPGIVHEWDDGQSPSMAVVGAVGTVTDRDPTAMEPLYGSIDTEALDDLFRGRSAGTVTVSFRYLDCTVVVTDGFVHATLVDDYPN